MRLRDIWTLAKSSVSAWMDDYAPSMGAALSYYTVFSIAPLLIIVIAVAGLVFGADVVQGELVGQLRGLLGDEGAEGVESLLKAASQPSRGLMASIIGGITLLVGATSVFGELQSALDRIWRAPAAPSSGLWGMLRSRLLSFGMILAIGFLLLVSLVVSAGLAAMGKWWGAFFGGWEIVLQALNLLVSFGFITLLFALIYKLLPRVKVAWHDVWVGAAVTSLLFTIGKFLIGLYIGKSDVASGFGAAGSIALLLIWVYYSAQIFLLGAEFTWVFAHRVGSRAANPEALTSPPALRRPDVAKGQQRPVTPPAPAVPPVARPSSPGVVAARAGGRPRDGVGGIAAGVAIGLLLRLTDRLRGGRAS